MMTIRNGIHIESELKRFQDKARKWDKVLSLRKERQELKTRLHQIGQEEAKLYADTEKYKK